MRGGESSGPLFFIRLHPSKGNARSCEKRGDRSSFKAGELLGLRTCVRRSKWPKWPNSQLPVGWQLCPGNGPRQNGPVFLSVAARCLLPLKEYRLRPAPRARSRPIHRRAMVFKKQFTRCAGRARGQQAQAGPKPLAPAGLHFRSALGAHFNSVGAPRRQPFGRAAQCPNPVSRSSSIPVTQPFPKKESPS